MRLGMHGTTVDGMPRDACVRCWVQCCLKSCYLATVDNTPWDAE